VRRWSFFTRQLLHLFLVLYGGLWLASLIPVSRISHAGGITVGLIGRVSVFTGVVHQLWVPVFRRLELGSSAVSRRFGGWGSRVYSVGFVLLITARIASIVYLAPLNRGTLALPFGIRILLVWIIVVLNLLGMY
jgi:hypothetical protein